MAEKKQPAKKQEPKVEQETEAQETESSSAPTVTYIVDGKIVDPEGNVVKGKK